MSFGQKKSSVTFGTFEAIFGDTFITCSSNRNYLDFFSFIFYFFGGVSRKKIGAYTLM